MKIEIKNRYGNVIFEHEQENNSLASTLEFALKLNVDLRGADLRRATLRGINLSGADLSGSDFYFADLRGAYLRNTNFRTANFQAATLEYANFQNSNLSYANFWGAKLTGANLDGAKLTGATGNLQEISSMELETFRVVFTKDILCIGCKSFTHDEWLSFDDHTISLMSYKALDFWEKWKDFIFSAIEIKHGKTFKNNNYHV